LQVLDVTILHALIQAADGVLGKVRTGAMGVQRVVVDVLLIDQNRGRIVGEEVFTQPGSLREATVSASRLARIPSTSFGSKRMRTVKEIMGSSGTACCVL
jgi:hypothetical protein